MSEKYSKKWLILINVCISVFMATIDGSIVNIALKTLSDNFNTGYSSVQWVVTSYILTISVLLLIWGKLADLVGKKVVLAFGIIVFTIGSALCGFSTNLLMLVLSRILQGIGASALMAPSQGIVTENFPPSERGKALGLVGTTVALGSLVGPVLGGFLVYSFGWPIIFFINIPIGIIGAIMTIKVMPSNKKDFDKSKFDFLGSALFCSVIILLFSALLFAQDKLISINLMFVLIAISIIIFILFIRLERKASEPLIDLTIFKNKIFSKGLISSFLSFVALYSVLISIPLYLQEILKYNPMIAGFIFAIYPLTTGIVAWFSGMLSDKISYQPLILVGLGLNTVCLLLFTFVNIATPLYVLITLLVFLGIGSATFQSPNSSSIMGSVTNDKLGVAGGLNSLFRNLGMVSGLTATFFIFSFVSKLDVTEKISHPAGFEVNFMNGFRIVLICSAVVCLFGFLISLSRVYSNKQAK
jgi:EmrB/QacA subfamily drug resistance transporter